MDAASILAKAMEATQLRLQEGITEYLTPIELRMENGKILTASKGALIPGGGPIPECIDFEFESVMAFEQVEIPVKVSVKLDFNV